MKKQNWIINLCIIGLLWFSLAFSCNNGSQSQSSRRDSGTAPVSRGTRSNNTTTSRDDDRDDEDEAETDDTDETASSDVPTEQDFKNAVERQFTNANQGNGADGLKNFSVAFDSPVKIGAPSQYHPGGYYSKDITAYPARVDFTTQGEHEYERVVSRHQGGTVYIAKNEFGEWKFLEEADGQLTTDTIPK